MRAIGSLFTLILFIGIMIEIIIFSPKETGTPEAAKAKTGVQTSPETDQWIKGVHLTETREGKKEWELQAERAQSMKDKEKATWILKEVNSKIFNNDGNYFTVVGDEGIVTANKDMKVVGHVIVTSSNGYVFRTQSVNYNSKAKTLQTDDPVQMNMAGDKDGAEMHLDGVGLFASMDDNYMDVLKDVKVNKALVDGRKVIVKSQKARFFSKSRLAQFTGDVIVDIGASRITGPLAKFEYDSGQKQLSSMEVEGGVNMTDADKWATAGKIRMSFLNDEFSLYQEPRLVQNNDEIRGDQIVFSDGGKKVKIIKGKAKFGDLKGKK